MTSGWVYIWHLVECPVCDVPAGQKCHAAAQLPALSSSGNAVCHSRHDVWSRRRKYWRDGDHGGLSGGMLERRLEYMRARRAERLAAR